MLFEERKWTFFTPRAGKLQGSYILTLSGVLIAHRSWTLRSMYRNPFVILRTLAVATASLIKRRLVRLDEKKTYAAIHSIWTAGYYHWITESLPRALVARDIDPNAIVLLPSEKHQGYEESLNLLGCEAVERFPKNANLLIHHFVMTECPRRFASTEPALLRRVRETILKNSDAALTEPQHGKKIYVSRKKSRGRFVSNESDIEKLLITYDFEIVCFEDLSFPDQVKLMSQSKMLISIHGAALTNMLFMPQGSTVVELIPRKNGFADFSFSRLSLLHDRCYIELAQALGHTHNYIECDSDAPWYRKTHMANIFVETARIEEILRAHRILKSSSHNAMSGLA